MEGAAVSAISSVLTSTIRIAEKIFEICAVDEQARGLLETVDQVSGQLEDARTLRRQKSFLFTAFEKRMFEDTFLHTDKALSSVAALAERPRADMAVSGGRLRATTRILFVLRDSPGIQVSLTQLGIASQSLSSTIMVLSSRAGRVANDIGLAASVPVAKLPPTYAESEFLSAGRMRNLQRRESAMNMQDGRLSMGNLHPTWTRSSPPESVAASELDASETSIYPLPEMRAASVADGAFAQRNSIALSLHEPRAVSVAGGSLASRGSRESLVPEIRPSILRNGRARSQSWLEERCM